MTHAPEIDLPHLAPELAVLLEEELFAGNQIAEIWVGWRGCGMRIVLRHPFRARHRATPPTVEYREIVEVRGRQEEYVSLHTRHVLASGRAAG